MPSIQSDTEQELTEHLEAPLQNDSAYVIKNDQVEDFYPLIPVVSKHFDDTNRFVNDNNHTTVVELSLLMHQVNQMMPNATIRPQMMPIQPNSMYTKILSRKMKKERLLLKNLWNVLKIMSGVTMAMTD
jgi:hypothetical protein